MVDIGTLIVQVYQRPCLWDQYCKEYYNREQVASSWKKIGEILKVKSEYLLYYTYVYIYIYLYIAFIFKVGMVILDS